MISLSRCTSGEERTGYIQTIREDVNLDVTLRSRVGYRKIEPKSWENPGEALDEEGGVLLLHDKSDPDEIRNRLQMSKKKPSSRPSAGCTKRVAL